MAVIRDEPLNEDALLAALLDEGYRINQPGWRIACGSFQVEAVAARVLIGHREPTAYEADGVPVHAVPEVIRDDSLPADAWELRRAE